MWFACTWTLLAGAVEYTIRGSLQLEDLLLLSSFLLDFALLF